METIYYENVDSVGNCRDKKKMEMIHYVDSVGNGGDNLLETDGNRNTLVWLSRTALGAHLRGLIC